MGNVNENLSDMAGTGISVEIKGKTYDLAILNLKDLAEFEGYIRSQRLKQFLSASNGLDPLEKRGMVTSILQMAISEDEVVAEMGSISGACFLLYRALRHNPGIELDNMGDLVDLQNLPEITAILQAIGARGLPPTEESEENA